MIANAARLALDASVNGAIVLMLLWMLFWDTEPGNPIRRYWIPAVQRPFLWLGLNAEWRMFAFNPPRHDLWPLVVMTLADGQVLQWQPADLGRLTVAQKLRFKKLHKYYFTVVSQRHAKHMYRDLIEHAIGRTRLIVPCVQASLYVVAVAESRFGDINPSPAVPARRLLFSFRFAPEGLPA